MNPAANVRKVAGINRDVHAANMIMYKRDPATLLRWIHSRITRREVLIADENINNRDMTAASANIEMIVECFI